MQRFITGFPTKLCHLYLSPMRCIVMISLSKSFHAGLISQSFSQPNFCTIWQSNLLCTSCNIRTVIYVTYLNVFYYTYYRQLVNRTLHIYQVCSYEGMTYSSRKNHYLALANYLPPYYCSYIARLFLFSAYR